MIETTAAGNTKVFVNFRGDFKRKMQVKATSVPCFKIVLPTDNLTIEGFYSNN